MLDNLAVTALAADPNTPMTMYAGTGEAYTGAVQGLGVFKSTDGGETWDKSTSGLPGVHIG